MPRLCSGEAAIRSEAGVRGRRTGVTAQRRSSVQCVHSHCRCSSRTRRPVGARAALPVGPGPASS